MKFILILEDNPVRVALLQHAIAQLESEFLVKVWNNVPAMRAECESYFPNTALISLDHDLNPEPGTTADPGTGIEGSLVTAPDTVPFCLWMAAQHLGQFADVLGKTISAGGDCDTNAAIVGGIVVLSAGREGIPVEWLKAREAIHL